jgi:hypothetical protein
MLKNFELHQTMRLRFQNATSATASSITFRALCDLLIVAVNATTGYQVWDFVRVVKVEMWAITSSTAVTTIGVDFGDPVVGVQADGGSFENCSVGSGQPAHLKCRPNPKSQSAQFQASAANTAFHIRTSGGSDSTIVEVTLECKNSSVLNPTAATVALVGATTGEFYFRGLDGLALASTNWPSLLLPDTI